ncbi:RagB/SusD family nutrient uptake outer membrane protein [Snuella lapsa]|uniref:RagB/SusD family nutrient uptake outer membrane protein n=1 Tax=Snuella lapsa TaxID=870481 RepID=A0ABP6XWS6_9FLAO
MKTIFKLIPSMGSPALTLVLLITTIFSACEDFVEIAPPDNQLTGAIVFEDAATVNAALADIYAQLRDGALTNGGTSGVAHLLGHYTDELTLYSTALQQVQFFYDNNLLATNSAVLGLWNSSYNLIYATNNIIENTKKASALTQEDKDQFLGEAYFIRAFVHFYLVNLFGDIPYVESTDYRTNTKVARLSEAQVYQKLIDDLVLSKSLLPESYVGANRTRPNKWVSAALLARVYLYDEKWSLALDETTQILSNGDYVLNTEIDQVFLKNSPETLWQFDAGIAGANTIDAQTYIFTSGPPPNSALSDTFMNAFESGDARFTHWTGAVTNGVDTWYYPFKYKQNSNTGTTMECSIVFRLAEIYLMAAESNAQLGHTSEALEQLNAIRERADLAALTDTDSASLLEAIFQERRIELFTEMGHRFLDLKRTDRADAELSPIKPNWQSTDVRLPIPESELILNPNLNPQNDGY